MKQGTDNAFKCDFCNEIFAEKMLNDYIGNIHKKFSLWKRIFTTNKSLESDETAVHKKDNQKTRLKEILVWKIIRTKETSNQNFSELNI